jgi:lysophospholipase L1-like esterase
VPVPSVRVCFFGDSITAGVGDDTALGWVGRVVAAARRDGVDLTGYNLGIRGETGPQVQARWATEAHVRLRRGDAYGVVVAFGVNDTIVEDGRRWASESETLSALERVAEQADNAGWPLLVVGPTLVDDAEHNRRILALSEAMGARCADLELPFIEVATRLRDDEWLREVATRDGAHPTDRGYERLSTLIYPAFADWLRALTPTGGSANG